MVQRPLLQNKDRREASTTELLAMGSTCSTLDGVDGPRSRVSQIEQEQREKDATALEYEIARWMEADEECRALQTDVTFDPRESSRRQSQPVWKSKFHGQDRVPDALVDFHTGRSLGASRPGAAASGTYDLPRTT